jgi:hypothetical protein
MFGALLRSTDETLAAGGTWYNDAVTLAWNIKVRYFLFFAVNDSCCDGHSFVNTLWVFIIMLLHDIIIWANLLVCLQLSTIAAGFIFTHFRDKNCTFTCLWKALECLYVYCSNGIHTPKHDTHITCLLHKAWRCTGIFTQRTPKLQLRAHFSRFQTRVSYPPIG